VETTATTSLRARLCSWWTESSGLACAQTRLQAKGNPYRSSADVIRHAVREQGLRGLWVGSTPSMVTAWATPACAWPMPGGCRCYGCYAALLSCDL
jgi:hypothetical protein